MNPELPGRAEAVHAVLGEILQAAARERALTDLLRVTYEQLGRIMDTSNFYVALYDPDTELYSFPFSVDQDDDDFTPQELRNSLTDYVRRTGDPLLCDSARHRRLIADGHVAYVGGYSPIWLGVPLRTPTGTLGVAVVQSYTDPDRFVPDDLRVMTMVCNGVASAIEQAWARENLAAARRLEVQQLAASRDEAVRANDAKSTFLAHMSHELRTPLNAILGYAELALDELSDAGVPQGTHELTNIHGAATHLLRIINEILDLSKIEAGREPVTVEAFTLREMADQVASLAAPLAASGDVSFASVLSQDDAVVRTDRGKLVQVVVNLVGNACRFARGRSVSVRWGLQDDPTGRRVVVDVADTGDGMDPGQIERMFQPFEQADPSSTRGGTGLGLAISRGYCRLLGGDLTARSLPGRGSTFRAVIPDVPA